MFHPKYRLLTMDDIDYVKALTLANGNFTSMTWWAEPFLSQYATVEKKPWVAFVDNCLIGKPIMGNDAVWFAYPIGAPDDRRRLIRKIYNHYDRRGISTVFHSTPKAGLEEIQQVFGPDIQAVQRRDSQIYILSSKEQLAAQGAAFADRRRRLHRFSNTYNWSYVEMTPNNLDECRRVNQEWYDSREDTGEGYVDGEQTTLKHTLDHFEELGMQGGLLYVEDKPVAFCIGVAINDEVYHMPYHKSLLGYRDSMLVLLHEYFVRHCEPYEYINCSVDLGIPGLRQFKMKLRPAFMTDCYEVTIPTTRPVTLRKQLRKIYRMLRHRPDPQSVQASSPASSSEFETQEQTQQNEG